MKFACHYELRDNPYPTYSVYALDLYDLEDLENVPGRRVHKESWGVYPVPGFIRLLSTNTFSAILRSPHSWVFTICETNKQTIRKPKLT